MFSKHYFEAKANLLSGLAFPFLSIFLAVDSLNGFLVLGVGLDFGVSALYKSVLLCILLLYLCLISPKKVGLIFSAIIVLSLGEIINIFSLVTGGDKVTFFFQNIFKVLSPLILFFFLVDRSKRDPDFYAKLLIVINVNGFIFFLNMLAGYFGLGFSTYGEGREVSVGSKGYFYAGNEISALALIFCAFYVASAYLKNNLQFLLVAVLYLGIGFLISTKTALLSIVMLVFITPALYEGRRLLLFSNGIAPVYLVLICIVLIEFVTIYEAFKDTPMHSRLFYVYETYGLTGLVLSSRDVFIEQLWTLFVSKRDLYGLFWGQGISFYAEFAKYSTEIDLVDMFLWHGLVGLATIAGVFLYLTHRSWFNFWDYRYPYARIILVTNLMLLGVSNLSGHVFTSGMLAFIWPCFAILASYNPTRFSER